MAYVPPHLRGQAGGASAAARAAPLSAAAAQPSRAPVSVSDGSKSRGWVGASVSPTSAPVAQGVWRREAGARAAVERRSPVTVPETIPLRVVEIDSLVLMKIIKHWR